MGGRDRDQLLRCIILTARRLGYFRIGRRHAWFVPGINDNTLHNSPRQLSESCCGSNPVHGG